MSTTDPKPGDTLYRCFDGDMETAIVEAFDVAPGARSRSLLMRAPDGERFRCSREMFELTHEAALRRYRDEVSEGIANTLRAVEETNAHLGWLGREYQRISAMLDSAAPGAAKSEPPREGGG